MLHTGTNEIFYPYRIALGLHMHGFTDLVALNAFGTGHTTKPVRLNYNGSVFSYSLLHPFLLILNCL